MIVPFKIYVYSEIYNAFPSLQEALGTKSLENHFKNPHFSLTDDHREADFFLFPASVDPLFQKLGPRACNTFLAALPHYREHKEKHIFFMYDDQNLPLGLPSVIYRFTHDRHLLEPNSITLPSPIAHGTEYLKKPERLAYHVSFTGALTTHFCRLQMLMPFLKPAERDQFKELLPSINNLQSTRIEPQQYISLHDQLKTKMKKFFPRIAQSKGITYYLNATFDQFRLLPESDRKQLFSKHIEIMQNSLLVLAPRGHGSYSVRFFETLAAGRIPVMIADNYLPPLHWLINYNDIIFRIRQNQLLNIKQLMADIFNNHQLPELEHRCFKARGIWEKYFSPDKFSSFLHLTLCEVINQNYNLNQIK